MDQPSAFIAKRCYGCVRSLQRFYYFRSHELLRAPLYHRGALRRSGAVNCRRLSTRRSGPVPVIVSLAASFPPEVTVCFLSEGATCNRNKWSKDGTKMLLR